MLETFFQGGPIFMGILSLILVAMLAVVGWSGLELMRGKMDKTNSRLALVPRIGLFAFIMGLLGQLIGLFSAFRAIELQAVEASPSLILSGFKISMISSVYGLLIFIISLAFWFGLKYLLSLKS
ncbi:hypothetical protein E0K83_09500 [Gramella sp. BOM4]|nr:hypothetical protein [Christiangramia bathymodioli]